MHGALPHATFKQNARRQFLYSDRNWGAVLADRSFMPRIQSHTPSAPTSETPTILVEPALPTLDADVGPAQTFRFGASNVSSFRTHFATDLATREGQHLLGERLYKLLLCEDFSPRRLRSRSDLFELQCHLEMLKVPPLQSGSWFERLKQRFAKDTYYLSVDTRVLLSKAILRLAEAHAAQQHPSGC